MPGNASLNSGIAELVLSAGPIAKIVLGVLAVFSIICWALIVEKWWEFRRVRRDSARFLRVFREARRFSVVYGAAKKYRDSPLAQVYLAAGQEMASMLGSVEVVDRVLEESDEGLPGNGWRRSTVPCVGWRPGRSRGWSGTCPSSPPPRVRHRSSDCSAPCGAS